MQIESLTAIGHRLDKLVLSIVDRYMIPYSIVRTQCREVIEALFKCLLSSLDPFVECRLEMKLLEECVEELSCDLGW